MIRSEYTSTHSGWNDEFMVRKRLQIFKDWFNRNLGIFWFWATVQLFSTWLFWISSDWVGMDFVSRAGLPVIVFEVTTAFVLIIILDIIPPRITLFLRRYLPIIFALLIIIPLTAMFVLGTFVLFGYLSSLPLDYPEALALSIGITVFSSTLVILKGVYTWSNLEPIARYQPNLHTYVCTFLNENTPIFTGFRQRTIERESDLWLISYDTKRAETNLEISLGSVVALIALSLFFRIFNLSGLWDSRYADNALLMTGFLTIITILYVIDILNKYRKWRTLWIEYWSFVRDVTAPGLFVLDSLPLMRGSLYANIKSRANDVLQIHAEKIALNYGFPFDDSDKDNLDYLEYLLWYDRVYHKLKDISETLYDDFPIFKKLKDEFNRLKKEFYSEEFASLVRMSLILNLVNVANIMPDVFLGISELALWETDEESTRINLFEFATRELELIKGLGSIPVPSSIAWLLGCFVFALSIIPYAITVGIAIVG